MKIRIPTVDGGRAISALILGIALLPSAAFAWGDFGHEIVNYVGAALMDGTPMGQWFKASEVFFRRLGETPDREFKDGDLMAKEHDLHFISADAFVDLAKYTHNGEIDAQGVADAIRHLPVSEPFGASYKQLSPLLAANSAEVAAQHDQNLENPNQPTIHDVSTQGTLPWRILQLYDLGVGSLSKGDVKMGMYYLGLLGHYIGDASQPFHTSMNYNPGGIHSIYETVILNDYAREHQEQREGDDVWDLADTGRDLAQQAKQMAAGGAPMTRQNLLSAVMELVASGYPLQKPLVDALNQAKRNMPQNHNNGGHGRHQRLPDDVVEKFMNTSIQLPDGQRQTVLQNAQTRLAESAVLFSQVMQSAYQDAKKNNPGLDAQLASPANRMTIDDDFARFTTSNYPEWHPLAQGVGGCGVPLERVGQP